MANPYTRIITTPKTNQQVSYGYVNIMANGDMRVCTEFTQAKDAPRNVIAHRHIETGYGWAKFPCWTKDFAQLLIRAINQRFLTESIVKNNQIAYQTHRTVNGVQIPMVTVFLSDRKETRLVMEVFCRTHKFCRTKESANG